MFFGLFEFDFIIFIFLIFNQIIKAHNLVLFNLIVIPNKKTEIVTKIWYTLILITFKKFLLSHIIL